TTSCFAFANCVIICSVSIVLSGAELAFLLSVRRHTASLIRCGYCFGAAEAFRIRIQQAHGSGEANRCHHEANERRTQADGGMETAGAGSTNSGANTILAHPAAEDRDG